MSERLSLDRYRRNAAEISADGRYRYTLERDWTSEQRELEVVAPPGVDVRITTASGVVYRDEAVLFVMLNPSTADARFDDPTIRRCVGFARAWGYNRLLVGNLFALRATDPATLLTDPDPVGPANDDWLATLASRATIIVAAWDAAPVARDRGRIVLAGLRTAAPTYTLGLTKDGAPRHPLYLPGALLPQPLL